MPREQGAPLRFGVYFDRFVHAEGFFRQFEVYFYCTGNILTAVLLAYAFVPFVELSSYGFNADVYMALD
jgi:hypothetical protein